MSTAKVAIMDIDLPVVLAVVGLIAMGVIFFLQRKPKRLDYFVTMNSDLAPRAQEWTDDISVMVGDTSVESPRLFGIRLQNTGKEPIKHVDFEEPLRVSLGANILAQRIAAHEPPGLNHTVENIEGRWLTIQPVLLNQGDWFEIEGLVDGPTLDVTVEGRIVGIKNIRDRTGARPSYVRDREKHSGVSWLAYGTVVALLFVSMALSWVSIGLARDANEDALEASGRAEQLADEAAATTNMMSTIVREANLQLQLIHAVISEDEQDVDRVRAELDQVTDELDELVAEDRQE